MVEASTSRWTPQRRCSGSPSRRTGSSPGHRRKRDEGTGHRSHDRQGRPAVSGSENRRVAQLHSQGLIRDLFFKANRSGPVLLLNDTTAEHARQQLATLPLVEHKLMTYDYIELDDTSPF